MDARARARNYPGEARTIARPDPQARALIRSMTAFARAERRAEWGGATWELRSVNNRYLDVATRLPEDLRRLETEVRDRVRARLHRGKVDCHLWVSHRGEGGSGFALDPDVASHVVRAVREVEELMEDPGPLSAIEVLRWPGVIRPRAVDLEAVADGVLQCLEDALEDLNAARRREGEKIAAMLQERLDAVQALVDDARARLPDIVATARERLSERLSELAVEVDRDRLEQEIALAAQKTDVAEELDRLQAHLVEVRRVLGKGRPAGRRLDFLMQELNREANTVGAKSIDTGGTLASVDLKVLIEQMREQIQNVE